MRGLVTDHVISGPMRGIEREEKNAFYGTDRQTDGHTTDGHRNSKTESAQWADSVKTMLPFS